MFSCLFTMFILLTLCVFVIILHVSCLFFNNFSNFNSSSDSVFLHVHVDIDKDTDCHKGNNNACANDLSLIFLTSIFYLKVWFNSSSNINVKLFFNLVVVLQLFCYKNKLKLQIIMKL